MAVSFLELAPFLFITEQNISFQGLQLTGLIVSLEIANNNFEFFSQKLILASNLKIICCQNKQ